MQQSHFTSALWVILIGLSGTLFSQEKSYFESRTLYFKDNFAKGNILAKKSDLIVALKFKDSLYKINRSDLLAEHMLTVGKMYQRMGQMTSAEGAFQAGLRLGRNSKDSIWVAKAYSRIGGFYALENRNFKALDYQMKSLSLFEKFAKEKIYLPDVYNEIANAYIQMGELKTAEQYLEKSLKLKKELKDTLRLGIINNMYADIYRQRGDYAKAEQFYLNDLPKREKQKNYEGAILSYLGLGDTYLGWKKYEKAESIFLKALSIADTIKRPRFIGISLVKLGELYLNIGRKPDAERVFKRAINECTQVDSRIYQLAAYKSMYKLYKDNNQLNEAIYYLEKYLEINQIYSDEAFELKAEDMTAAYELRQKEEDLLRLTTENNKNAQIQKILTLGLVLLIVLSSFLIFLYSGRNTALKKLFQEQQNTKNLLREKEMLLENLESSHHQLVHSEKMASIGVMTAGIAHELNNPVGSIHASAEALKMDYDDLVPLFKVLDHIKKTNDQAHWDNLLYLLKDIDIKYLSAELETLLNTVMNGSVRTSQIIQGLKTFTRDSGDTKEPYFIEDGLDAALTLLHHKFKDQITIKKQYEFGKTLLCNGSKLNQVFLNVLDNAIQALSGEGIISIATKEDNNYCIIKISDNGHGMDTTTQKSIFQPFFTTKEIGKGTGLGLAISYAIVKDHQGEMQVISAPGQGTAITISIPIQ